MESIENIACAQKIEPLLGTVKLYHRHLLVCTGSADWPERIEESSGFLQTLAEVMARRMLEMPLKVKMTACDAPSLGSGCDMLVFPDQIRYLGVRETDLPALVEDHLVGNRVSKTIPHEPLKKPHIFICVHGKRDMRCGQCGPPLMNQFNIVLESQGLADEVIVLGTSHVGGHRFAGNVLIYPSGDWYGYVTPADAFRLIEQHLIKGEVVTDLWRGRMGLSPTDRLSYHCPID